MRPRGEVRAALAVAVARLAAEQGPVSAREAACAAQVGYEVARLTLKDMSRSTRPEVVRVGWHNGGSGRVWNALYEPARDAALDARSGAGIDTLAKALSNWTPAHE